jgi:hypothetical protein
LKSQSLKAWRSWRVFSIEPTVPQSMDSGSGAVSWLATATWIRLMSATAAAWCSM